MSDTSTREGTHPPQDISHASEIAQAKAPAPTDEDDELTRLKQKLADLEAAAEAEAKRLREEAPASAAGSVNSPKPAASSSAPAQGDDRKDAVATEESQDGQKGSAEVDARSIYVGNVDYSTTPEQLLEIFSECGNVARVTIGTDKYTGQPKGYAYVEFTDPEAAKNAEGLTGREINGRPIKVARKRVNVPGMSTTNRGRGYGRGMYRGGAYFGGYPMAFMPPYPPQGIYMPVAQSPTGRGRGRGGPGMRGRGGNQRGRGNTRYTPY